MSYVFFSPGGFGRKFRLRFFRRSGSSLNNQNLWMKGFAGWSYICFSKLKNSQKSTNFFLHFLKGILYPELGEDQLELSWRRRNPVTFSAAFGFWWSEIHEIHRIWLRCPRVWPGYRSASICAFAFTIKFEEAEISNATGLLEQLLKVCTCKAVCALFLRQ